jgi:hypothetical protein
MMSSLSYWIDQEVAEVTPDVVQSVADRVFRSDFREPGFCVVAFPQGTDSVVLRQLMVTLKEALSNLYEHRFGESLEYVSMGRFDQQNTTRLHLDGAPARSFLMLGYEPTTVRSEFHIADYSRCAEGRGLTPLEFLAAHNPMMSGQESLLADELTLLQDWQEHRPRIVVVNNCSTAPGDLCHTPGVLHGARILEPDPEATRVINSTMTVPQSLASEGSLSSAVVQAFLHTQEIAGEIRR